MRCELCSSLGRLRHEDGLLAEAKPSAGVSCEVCGQPVLGARDRVIETLAQLARFGLTGQMLLSRRGS